MGWERHSTLVSSYNLSFQMDLPADRRAHPGEETLPNRTPPALSLAKKRIKIACVAEVILFGTLLSPTQIVSKYACHMLHFQMEVGLA